MSKIRLTGKLIIIMGRFAAVHTLLLSNVRLNLTHNSERALDVKKYSLIHHPLMATWSTRGLSFFTSLTPYSCVLVRSFRFCPLQTYEIHQIHSSMQSKQTKCYRHRCYKTSISSCLSMCVCVFALHLMALCRSSPLCSDFVSCHSLLLLSS